jgi:hypothetical protein
VSAKKLKICVATSNLRSYTSKRVLLSRLSKVALSAVLILIGFWFSGLGVPGLPQQSSATPAGTMMPSIFLKHDQSKKLDAIQAHLKQTGFDENFPPAGTEVASWYVMMGIGQVVTLRFPAEQLREVNLAIEHGVWGAYHTDFYPTYDYKAGVGGGTGEAQVITDPFPADGVMLNWRKPVKHRAVPRKFA